MSKIKINPLLLNLSIMIIFLSLCFVFQYFDSFVHIEVNKMIFGIDDILLATAGTAVAGGIGGLFKKKRDNISLDDLLKAGYQQMDPEKVKADNEKMVADEISNIRNHIEQRNASKGIITPQNYAAESPLWDNLAKMNLGVDERARKEKNDIAKYLLDYNQKTDLYNDSQPDFIDNFLNAGLIGGTLAAGFKKKDIGGDITVDDLKQTNLISQYLNNNSMDLNEVLGGGNGNNVGMPGAGGMPIPGGMPGAGMPPDTSGGVGNGQDNVIAGIPVQMLVKMQPQDLIRIIMMLDVKLKSLMTDSVPTMLSPGEKVINKEANQMAGPALDQLNLAGLNQRGGSNVDIKNEYTYDELIQMKSQNPDAYNYILQQAAAGKIKVV
jgi:hypothetical protein